MTSPAGAGGANDTNRVWFYSRETRWGQTFT